MTPSQALKLLCRPLSPQLLFSSFAAARREIAAWIRWYNEARPHQAQGLGVREKMGRNRVNWYLNSGEYYVLACGRPGRRRGAAVGAELFGIVTVEAMAAGCVPIVIRKGGQPEIVEHGVSGFLWDTLEELKQYTELLARDEGLRARMATAARARALRFSRAAYVNAMLALLEPLLG